MNKEERGEGGKLIYRTGLKVIPVNQCFTIPSLYIPKLLSCFMKSENPTFCIKQAYQTRHTYSLRTNISHKLIQNNL